ncbi:Os04g0451000, partial [Oryza sativa Japonica Group]
EAFPPEQIPELAKYRPLLLLLHGLIHAVVVALVDVIELIVEVAHGGFRRRLEVGDVAQRREHPVLVVQVAHPRRLREAALELGGLADRVPPAARRPGLVRRRPPVRRRLRCALGAGDETNARQVLVEAVVRHGGGPRRRRGAARGGRRRRRGGEQAVELLEAALRGGLADLDALVLLPEALQRAVLLGDDVVEPGVLATGELQRLLDDVGLGDGLLQDVAEPGVLVADHALRLDELGVLLAFAVHLLLGRADAVEEHALLVAPRGGALLGVEPAPVVLVGHVAQPRLGGVQLVPQPLGLGIGGLQLGLRLGQPHLHLLRLHRHVGERDGQVVERLPALLLPLHRRPELAAQGPDLIVPAAEHEVLDAPLLHRATPPAHHRRRRRGLEARVGLLQSGDLQLGLLERDLRLLQLLRLVY